MWVLAAGVAPIFIPGDVKALEGIDYYDDAYERWPLGMSVEFRVMKRK